MRITRHPNGDITIDQSAYIDSILERYGMIDCKPVSTPLAPGARLAKATENDKLADERDYQAIVGSLIYAMLCTRPDIGYTVQQLSQFCSKPTNAHYQAAKRALRYLKGTRDLGVTFRGSDNDTEEGVQSYCDVDFASNEDRKSISGCLFTLAGAPISWEAKK